MKVEQIMSQNVHCCFPDDTVDVAARLMWDQDCGCVPVVVCVGTDRPKAVAMLTDRDITMAAYTQGRPLHAIKVASAMSRDVCSCQPGDPVSLALKILEGKQLRRLPVVTGDNELVGIVSLADIAREARREHGRLGREVQDSQVAEAIEEISQPRDPKRALTAAA